MRLYVGADLGTSSIKLMVCDESGKLVSEAKKPYELLLPKPGYSEQDPNTWWESFKQCLRQALLGHERDEIRTICVAGQMHGLVALDENNEVIRNAILWNDGRSDKETSYLNEVIKKDKLCDLTGNYAFAGFTATKLLWMKENEKELFKTIKHILLPKDYIVYKLTGEYSTDYSDASGTLLLDVKNKKWSKEMCDIIGINTSILPNLHESYAVVKTISDEVADELSINKNIKVVAGAGDNASAAIGTGCINNNDCNISLGTSGTVFLSTDKFVDIREHPIHSFAHANGRHHLMGCVLSAASAYMWWIERILCSSYENEEKKLNALVGNNQVLFAPYLMGERCPYNDTNVRGAFLNLSLNTSKEEMTISVLEGVSFALNDCIELIRRKGFNIQNITLCGGGLKTPVWPKLLSNIMNVSVYKIKTEQGPAYGAVILGLVADKKFVSLDEACSSLIEKELIEAPDNNLVKKYANLYKYYQKCYERLK